MATQNPTHQLAADGSGPQTYGSSRVDSFEQQVIHLRLRQRLSLQNYARDDYRRWCRVPETLDALVAYRMMALQAGVKERFLDVVSVGEEREAPYQWAVKRW